MNAYRIRSVLKVVAVAALIIGLPSAKNRAAARHSVVSPFLKVGPQAIPAGVKSPTYNLFTCQVIGVSVDTTCYDPYQMRHAYGTDKLIANGFDGRGKTIVIVDAFQSPNIVAELNTFNAYYGLANLNGLGNPPIATLGTFTQVAPNGLTPFDPNDDDMLGWAEEITLDVEWAHAIAPGANITLVLSKSDDDADILSATKYAVDHNLGDVISQSFGENEKCMDPALEAQQHQVFADATAKNITLFASSGDSGSGELGCGGLELIKAASTPAVDPLVTAVGGTTLKAARYCIAALGCEPATHLTPGTYQSEAVWNEPLIGAGGGGFSLLYPLPAFQNGIVSGKQRGEPDVSYDAAVLHGVLTYLDIPGIGQGFAIFGGTSAGSPQWAALIAIADQKAGLNLGLMNPALYQIAQSHPLYAASFFDITTGNNSFLGVPGFTAGTGWDAATGLGSPNNAQLIDNLIQIVTTSSNIQATVPQRLPYNRPSVPGRKTPF